MNYLSQEDGESLANNHVNKFEYDAQSTNVSAFGESMIQMDEISHQHRLIQEAELELNIERRKDANQDQEKQRIEVQVFDEEQKKILAEINLQKNKIIDRGIDYSTYHSHHNIDEQLLNPKRNREHYTKQQLDQKKQKWLKSKKYLFIQTTQDLETSIWKKKVFNIILIDYTFFIKNIEKRAELKVFLEKEMSKNKSINEIHIFFNYQRIYKEYIISQINLLKGFKQLTSITINLVGQDADIGIKEQELYKVYFKQLNFNCQKTYICDQLDADLFNEIIEFIQSNHFSLKEMYFSFPDINPQAFSQFIDFMNKEGFKNRKICHLDFTSSQNIDVFLDKFKNIPPSLDKLSLKFDNLDSGQQQKLSNELQQNNISNLRLYLGGQISIPISQFITHSTLQLKSYRLSFNTPVSGQQFNSIQENFKFLPKSLKKFHLELKVQDDNEVNLDPLHFSQIPQTIQHLGIIVNNNLDKQQTQNMGAIMTQLPIYTQSLNIQFIHCDTDILDSCISMEYVDLDKLQLSIENNLFPEQFTGFFKKIPCSTYHMKLRLRDYYIYDYENKNEYILVLSQLPQKLNYIVLDLGLLNQSNATILKQNIKHIKSDIIIILARYSDKEAKSILSSINKNNSSEIKIYFY